MCIAVKCLEEWSSTPTALIASSCNQASLVSNQNGHNLLLMHHPHHSENERERILEMYLIFISKYAAQPFECSRDHIWWRHSFWQSRSWTKFATTTSTLLLTPSAEMVFKNSSGREGDSNDDARSSSLWMWHRRVLQCSYPDGASKHGRDTAAATTQSFCTVLFSVMLMCWFNPLWCPECCGAL